MDKYYYEYDYDDYYCYPNHVLKNKLNIQNDADLTDYERAITSIKTIDLISGNIEINGFNFDFLKTIHLHLFEDIYEWAGNIRTVDIAKGNLFCKPHLIESQISIIFDQLKQEEYLKNIPGKNELGKRLAYYLSEINAIHPFREGNGRTQRILIELLAQSVGYHIEFADTGEEKNLMIEASHESFLGNYAPMENMITDRLMDNR